MHSFEKGDAGKRPIYSGTHDTMYIFDSISYGSIIIGRIGELEIVECGGDHTGPNEVS